nr:hypothetical protein [Tanacetum cinerariifolium]
MKTAPTVILIINDGDDSFTTAITTGLQTSNLKQSTEVFELSLERYRVTDVKATGSVTHFVDSNGVKQVICKIRETLASASPRYRENVKTSDGLDRMASIGSPAVHACTSLGLAVQIVSGERKNTFS